MQDELNQVVEPVSDVEAHQANFPQEVQPEQDKQVEQKIKDQESKEKSFRILSQRAEYAERRMQEMEQQIRAQSQQREQPKIQEDDDDDELDVKDEDFVEGKHLKRPVKKLQKDLKETKKKLEEYQQRLTLDNARMRLHSEMPDFEKVVNDDTLKKLAKTKPALYRTLMASQDLYDCGYSAYEIIKNNNLHTNEYEAEDTRIEANKTKPRSVANVSAQTSESPLSRAGDYDRRILTEERKEQLRRQVEEAKRTR